MNTNAFAASGMMIAVFSGAAVAATTLMMFQSFGFPVYPPLR